MGIVAKAKDTIGSIVEKLIPDYKFMWNNAASWKNISDDTQSTEDQTYFLSLIIDRIAKDISRCEVKHLKNRYVQEGSKYAFALNIRANAMQSASDFLRLLILKLYTQFDVFINYIEATNEFEILDIYSVGFLYEKGEVFLVGKTSDGTQLIYYYEDIIHIRYRPKDIFLSAKNDDITTLIELLTKSTRKQLEELKNSDDIKGLLKLSTALNSDDKAKLISEFRAAVKEGIGVIDNKHEFMELKNDYHVKSSNIKDAQEQLSMIFGVNEKILSGTYSQEEYLAYKQNTLDPLTDNLSQLFTYRLFGNKRKNAEKIVFDLNKLMFSNPAQAGVYLTATKGVITINEARDIINLPPVDGGDEIRVSLNDVNNNLADEYQKNKASLTNTENTKGGANDNDNGKGSNN